MKNKDYQQSKMKKQLIQKRVQGLGFVVWKLNTTQKRNIEELGYIVEPYIYLVETRTFYNISKIHNAFLKELHYARMKKQCYVIRPLKRGQIELLQGYNVKFTVLKYKIYLCK